MFNDKNLIFSQATKLIIPYEEILSIEKRKTAVLFDNAIVITTINEGEIKFCTLLKRDTTYELLYDLVFNYTQSLQDDYGNGNKNQIFEEGAFKADNDKMEIDHSEIIEGLDENKHFFEENKESAFEEDKIVDRSAHWHFDKAFIQRLQNIAEINKKHLGRFDEEYSDENFKEFSEVRTEIYKGIDIRWVFFILIF